MLLLAWRASRTRMCAQAGRLCSARPASFDPSVERAQLQLALGSIGQRHHLFPPTLPQLQL
jgi:hypothetical protein